VEASSQDVFQGITSAFSWRDCKNK
jgi:hypothetical protein